MKLFIVALFLLSYNYSFAQFGQLRGQVMEVKEDSTKKAIPFATIKVYKHNLLIQEGTTDSLGRYKIENLKPDIVDVSCEPMFYFKEVKKGVPIGVDRITFVDFYLKSIKD